MYTVCRAASKAWQRGATCGAPLPSAEATLQTRARSRYRFSFAERRVCMSDPPCGSGDESKNAADALGDEPVDQVRGQRVRVRRWRIRGWPLRQTDRGNCRVVGDPPEDRAEKQPVAGADDRQDFCDGAVDRARQRAHPEVDPLSGDQLDL